MRWLLVQPPLGEGGGPIKRGVSYLPPTMYDSELSRVRTEL